MSKPILYMITLLLCSLLSLPAFAQPIVHDELISKDETLILESKNLPEGWTIVSDPELVKFGDQWWMFFNTMKLDFKNKLPIHIFAATLPKGKSLSAGRKKWKVHEYPVISPGAKGSWDDHTVETSKYIYGYDATEQQWVQRLYYLGWPAPEGKVKDYRIGLAQYNGKRWEKHPKPVVTGTNKWEKLHGKSFIGDQSLYYEPGSEQHGKNGIWHMWYQAVSKPIDGGISIVHVTSKDGITWSNKKRMKHKVPFANKFTKTGPFHLDVMVKKGRYYFVGFVYNQQDLSKQGLWLTSSSTPDGSAEGDFKDWYPLVYENNGTKWHDSGLESSKCHTTGLFAGTLEEDDGKFWLFYHGYYRTGKVDNPCTNMSKNSGAVGRVQVKRLP